MKIAVLLSGGVDSSVALNILKNEGHDVTAFYLKIWLEDELAFLGDCPWNEDLSYVRAVCDKLDIPMQIVNMQQEYLNTVIEYTIRELKAGRTPSPDIMCNKNIKFGEFFKKIDNSFEKVASGHYAQIEGKSGLFYLKESPDPVKDQTYFLTYLDQSQLSRILFPIGKYDKKEVRHLADSFDLPNKTRKDSQGICFLGKIKYNEFVKFHLGEKPGDIIELETGKIVGQHNGYWFHTIGQRQGLGLGGGPWYVVKKDLDKNIIYISNKNNFDYVPRKHFTVGNINWITEKSTKKDLLVKLRHGVKKYPVSVNYLDDGRIEINLPENDQGISAGQYAIFYDNGYCLGGGVIE